jgi:hypothetical protein
MTVVYQPFLKFDTRHWMQIRDGNLLALDIFSRHYSFRKWRQRDGKNGTRFTGPGESLILLSHDGRALFVWVKSKFRLDDQQGINCAVFRNESQTKSSELILEAEQWAWQRWPQQRLFTFVNPRKIKSVNPGYCFQMAGWNKCGISSKGLVILEKLQEVSNGK